MRSSSAIANAVGMLAAKLLPPVFAFAVHVSVARLAGPDTLGYYVHLLAVLMIFQAMAGAGMQYLVTREIAACPARTLEWVRHGRTFSVVSGGVAMVAYVAYALWLLPDREVMPALALSLTLLPSASIALHESVFIATRMHHRVAIIAIVENSLKMAIAVTALVAGQGLLAVCLGIAGARLAAMATGQWLLTREGLHGTWRLDFAAVTPFARAMAPFAVLFVLSMAYFRIDVAIVQALAGTTATGFYGAATTLFGAVLLLPESIMATAYPRLAARGQTSADGYAQATWLVAKFLTLGLVPVSLALIGFADVIVGLVYGPKFGASGAVLRLLALSLPIHALNGALGQALQARGEQRAMVGIVTVGVAVHVLLNVLLVSRLGIHGAPIAMLSSASCVALGAVWAVHRRVAPVRLTPGVVAALIPIAGPLTLVSLAPAGFRMMAIPIALAWFCAGSFWHGTLQRAELRSVLAALGGRQAGASA